MDKDMQYEYSFLRAEIDNKMKLHNTLLTFTITTTVAILTLACTERITILFLVPFGIIIPMSLRIAYYRSNMLKISAYMIEFLEPESQIQWETRHSKLLFRDKKQEKKQEKERNIHQRIKRLFFRFNSLYSCECFMLSSACYILYVWDYISDRDYMKYISIKDILMHKPDWFCVICPLILVIAEFIIMTCTNSQKDEREYWETIWKEVKNSSAESPSSCE